MKRIFRACGSGRQAAGASHIPHLASHIPQSALRNPHSSVAGCCHPVAKNVATLIHDYQRCNGCCHFSNFISALITIFDKGWVAQAPRRSRSAPRRPERGEAPSIKQPAHGYPSKASVALFTLLTRFDGNDTTTHKNTQLNTYAKTIGQFWKRKNARRDGLTEENLPNLTTLVR
jgi:hypothetical protein